MTGKYHILLVEDDPQLAELIAEYLADFEFEVAIECNGTAAVSRIIQQQPDLVILDLMLPGEDGISVCKRVRDGYDQAILMLTASQESVNHILGLEIGADDFLHKPVEPRVLLAHVRSLLRRQQKAESKPASGLRYGAVEISVHNRWVKVSGKLLQLSDQEFRLLQLLLEPAGQIRSRDEISLALKGVEYDGESRYCDIMISQLRQQLNSDGVSGRHIKTVRNQGYLFVTEF